MNPEPFDKCNKCGTLFGKGAKEVHTKLECDLAYVNHYGDPKKQKDKTLLEKWANYEI